MDTLINSYRKAYYYLCYFIFYSFLGWFTETIYVSITEYRIAGRGFLFGPFCPVYGFGVLLIVSLLQPLRGNKIIVFTAAVLLTSTLEYITGFILERAFDSRWWDYSHEFLNLHGRICLRASFSWGLAAFIMLHFIHPVVQKLVEGISMERRLWVSYLVLFYFVADFSASVTALIGLKIFMPIIPLLYPIVLF